MAVLAYRALHAMGASALLSFFARGQAKPGCASPLLVPVCGPYAPDPAKTYQYKYYDNKFKKKCCGDSLEKSFAARALSGLLTLGVQDRGCCRTVQPLRGVAL